ncbi:MAG: hypothetical protein CMP49_05800 [Flavobacteriales bacterium]|nr:hypothetical protein [Flavobacteriales bacterium]
MFKKITSIIIITLCVSCYNTKHIASEDFLLAKNTIIINGYKSNRIDGISNKEIHNIIKQSPNKKIIGLIPFHIWLYNLSNPEKNNWINSYLRKIGEKPVILNQELLQKSITQIKSHFENNGYFNSNVTHTINLHKKKAYIDYKISTGESYIINKIKYPSVDDYDIDKLIELSIKKSEIKKGDVFTYNDLNKERFIIEKVFQDNGYYKFTKDLIYIQADSTENKLVNIIFDFKDVKTDSINYIKFDINNIFIHLDNNAHFTDTIKYNNYYFIKPRNENFKLKLNVIEELIKIQPNNQYSEKDVETTYNNLSNLAFFKKIEIEFIENPLTNQLNCNINIEDPIKMYYSIETEVKRSADEGNIGVSSYLQFGNNNLLKGAENLNSKIKISLSNRQAGSENSDILFNTKEISYELGIRKPKLILPKKLDKWLVNSFQMNTQFVISATKRERPDFSSQTITQKLGYSWKNANNKHHQFNLIELSFSDIEENEFINNLILNNIYLQEQFEDKFIPAINYIYTFNNQKIYKITNYTYFKSKIETSGNFFQILGQTGKLETNENDDFMVFNNPFSQYAKIDFDFRRYLMFSKYNTFVFRSFLGIAYAYGNSEKIPIQKQFFSGGVNSIRAWEAFNLGPGTSSHTNNNYATGDLKLEFNLEYRFDFINSLKSALFIDGGNIWLLKENNQSGSTFKLNKFYHDIALGAGIGFRYDFDFFVIRLDLASIIRDPSQNKGERWVNNIFNRKYRYNLAIGYPF